MTARVINWLEDRSDWLSPLVVKEVRQAVRSREFSLSFGACLVAGLVVAFVGATDALAGGTAGRWTFVSLMACLAFLKRQPFIDSSSMASDGASYVGYMMNWFHGHT